MTEAGFIVKTAVLLAWLLLLFTLERVFPSASQPEYDDGRFGWQRLCRNAGLWLTGGAASVMVVVPVSVWATSLAIFQRPEWWSGSWGLVLDILLLDCWIYWWHRSNHYFPLLWRFHEVHHLDHFLDTTTGLRFHFGELMLSAVVRAVLVILFALPLTSILVFEALVLVSTLFHHSNLRLPARTERVLSWIVVTPSIHWIHHHAVRCDTDSNYASVFSWWDRIFATRSATSRTPSMPIGVEGRAERNLPGLLIHPLFRPKDKLV